MNRTRRFFALALLASASCGCALVSSGCVPYTQAQINLTDQAKRGIALVEQNDQERDRAIEDLAKLRRQRLDDAFDEDVRTRAMQETLDPDWVIEARKAYASGLDAYAKSHASNERASEMRRQNVAAIDAALDRLRWMQSIQLKLENFPQEKSK